LNIIRVIPREVKLKNQMKFDKLSKNQELYSDKSKREARIDYLSKSISDLENNVPSGMTNEEYEIYQRDLNALMSELVELENLN
jgi:hypothetical protein